MGFLKDLMNGHEKFFKENTSLANKIKSSDKPVLTIVEEKEEEVKAA